jgi:hypothetical protein
MGMIFEASVQPLERWGRQSSRMVVLRDVTEREAAQQSLSDAGKALKLRLRRRTCACRNSWNVKPFMTT